MVEKGHDWTRSSAGIKRQTPLIALLKISSEVEVELQPKNFQVITQALKSEKRQLFPKCQRSFS